jgi:hypothetical protein
MKKTFFIVLPILFLLSCGRTVDCTDPPISLSFISFSPNALSNIIIRKFNKGSNFQSLVDTIQITAANAGIINRGDTSLLNLYDPDQYPKPGFDWQIFIPAINRTIMITDIEKRDKTGKCATMQMPVNCGCYNEILNLKVDNQAGEWVSQPVYQLYIR